MRGPWAWERLGALEEMKGDGVRGWDEVGRVD